jgi:hypothetical protein
LARFESIIFNVEGDIHETHHRYSLARPRFYRRCLQPAYAIEGRLLQNLLPRWLRKLLL